MQDFIDLTGASGAAYRFRRRAPGALHLPTAGNFVLVQGAGAQLRVLTIGIASDLSQANPSPPEAAARKPAVAVFTRLNVARAVREAEHADLVAAYGPVEVVTDAG